MRLPPSIIGLLILILACESQAATLFTASARYTFSDGVRFTECLHSGATSVGCSSGGGYYQGAMASSGFDGGLAIASAFTQAGVSYSPYPWEASAQSRGEFLLDLVVVDLTGLVGVDGYIRFDCVGYGNSACSSSLGAMRVLLPYTFGDPFQITGSATSQAFYGEQVSLSRLTGIEVFDAAGTLVTTLMGSPDSQGRYFIGPLTEAGVSVPEPGSVAFVVTGSLLLWLGRRR